MTDVWLRWGLVMYGGTLSYDVRPGAERGVLPMGEGFPPGDYWRARYEAARTAEEAAEIERQAEEARAAWVRRPEPPPEGETPQAWARRIIREGEGWSAKDVALAERCTPRMIRRLRMEHERNPEDGRIEGSLTHARELLAQGATLRQVAMLTGIPKSTLHDALERAA